MRVSFECTHCRALLEVDASSEMFGQQVACPHCLESVVVPEKAIGPGVTLGGYLIQQELGRGAMGQVYLATQLSLGRYVALKTLPPEFAFQRKLVDRFLQEMRLAARLSHPHVVTVYEAGVDSGVYYFSMEYVEGINLEDQVARHGPLPEARALEIARKVATALRYAWHHHQLLHRDIKPGNILVDKHGEPKLTDLGLAKCLDNLPSLTMTSAVMGTPNYMSPEQAHNSRDVDCRADMYSLGATLYHVLTGQAPFAGSSVAEILRKQAVESLPHPQRVNPKISAACTALLEIMLAKDPAKRHQGWDEVIYDLDRVSERRLPSHSRLQRGESAIGQVAPDSATTRGATSATTAAAGAESRAARWATVAVSTSIIAVVVMAVWFSRERAALNEEKARLAQTPPTTVTNTVMLPAPVTVPRPPAARPVQPVVPPAEPELPPTAPPEADRQAQRARVVRELRQRAEQLLADGDPAAAITAVREYDGPLATAIVTERQSLVSELQARWAEQRLPEVVEAEARALLRQEFASATNLLTTAQDEVPALAVLPGWQELQELTAQVVRLPDVIENSFRAQIGSEIRLSLYDEELPLRILSVTNGLVNAEIVWRMNGEEVGSASRSFYISELRSADRFQRLGEEITPERDLMRGILAWEARDHAGAVKYLDRSATALGTAMRQQVEAQRQAARESGALQALDELWRVAGLTAVSTNAPDTVADAFAEKRFTALQIEKLQRLATVLQGSFSDTTAVRDASPVLAVIGQLRPGVPVRVGVGEITDLLSRLARANPGAREPEIKTVDGGLAVSFADDQHVTDLRPLAELPIKRLDLKGTAVAELSVLRDLPLEELRLEGLENPDLESVGTISTLRRLSLADCGRLSLTGLAALRLEELDLSGTSLLSLAPLRDMPLKVIRLVNTRVAPDEVRLLVAAIKQHHNLDPEIIRGDWRSVEPVMPVPPKPLD